MPRQSNTEARRADIVSALQRVMATQGYEKATVQAIAQEAGLAPGLIHYHFKNKQEILISLVHAIAAFGQARFEVALVQAGRPLDRLKAYIDARVGLGPGASAELVAAWVMIGAEAVRQPEVRAAYQQAISAELAGVAGLVRASLAEARRDTADATRVAAALLAMMEGAFLLASATQGVMPVGYAAAAAFDHARQAIGAARPA